MKHHETPDDIAAQARSCEREFELGMIEETIQAVEPHADGYYLTIPSQRDFVDEMWWTAVRLGAALEREFPAEEVDKNEREVRA